MTLATVSLPGKTSWIPQFVQSIAAAKCIGCGRCYKVCGRDVLQLMGMDDAGRLIAVEGDDDDDEYEKKVMTVASPQNCIGCEACARICPKKCYSHAPLTL